ncbi:hypothetical protein DL765_004611 [Monosporascus sp. GIB2]|nr:hypothetical protein DL765_004611 [Monosporascus sp. GIB2]
MTTAFDKKRQGNLVRVACLLCRSKKLECLYPGLLESNVASSKDLPESSKAPDTQKDDLLADGTQDTQTQNDYTDPGQVALQSIIVGDRDFDMADPLEISSADEYFNSMRDGGNNQQIANDRPPQLNILTPKSIGGLEARPHSGFALADSGSPSLPCRCLESAAITYQSVDLNLCWGLNELSGSACHGSVEALQYLKHAIKSCEALLECVTCSSRPEHITLICSMCNKVLQAIHEIGLDTGDKHLRDSNNEGRPRLPRLRLQSSPCGEILHRVQSTVNIRPGVPIASSMGDFLAGQQRKSDDTSKESQIGSWELDDEDEVQALRSLLSLRTERLGQLIDKLERIVHYNRWPAHTRIMQAIRDQFTLTTVRMK